MANEEKMESVAGALEEFRRLDFTRGMAVVDGCLTVEGSDRRYRPDQVLIADHRRFEGVSDPSDSSVVYAIETTDGVKGTLVDGYNAYADAAVGEFLQGVRVLPRSGRAPKPTVPAFERPSALNQNRPPSDRHSA
jgi:hypothetical protein